MEQLAKQEWMIEICEEEDVKTPLESSPTDWSGAQLAGVRDPSVVQDTPLKIAA